MTKRDNPDSVICPLGIATSFGVTFPTMRKLLIFLLLSYTTVTAAQQTCQQLVPPLMEADGVNDSLSGFPEIVKQSTDAQLAKDPDLTADQKASVDSALDRGINPQHLHSNIQQLLIQSCDAKAFGAVLQQLQSPLSKKMRTEEAQASTPQGAREMQDYVSNLPQHPPSGSRLQLLHELDAATKGSDFYADMIVAVSRAMAAGLSGHEPSKGELAELRSEVSQTASNQMIAMSVFIYRNVSDEELTQYVAMYKTAPFQTFNAALSKAFLQGISEEMTHVGQEIKKALDQQHKPTGKS